MEALVSWFMTLAVSPTLLIKHTIAFLFTTQQWSCQKPVTVHQGKLALPAARLAGVDGSSPVEA